MKTTLLFCFLAISQSVFSQIEKGNWSIGTQTGLLRDITNANNFTFEEKVKFSVSIHPNLGYFIAQDWMVGGKLGFGGEFPFNGGEIILFGLQPFSRNYFRKTPKSSFFLENSVGGFGVAETAADVRFGLLIDSNIGFSKFIWQMVSLDVMLKALLSHSKTIKRSILESDSASNYFLTNFQI